MTALRKPDLPEEFRNELARLVRAGFPLLPLGGGADGKAPLLKSWAGDKLALGRVLAPLYRSGSLVYGVRLDGLAVVDCDDDSAELVAQIEARFGPSPVHVKTPRGRHLYYRAYCAEKPPNLRGEGLPVDIKTGPRAYVVGPGSTRPDGGTYSPAKGFLGKDDLPPMRAPQGPQGPQNAPKGQEGGKTILVGHRHVHLVREAIRMVEYVDSAGELVANLAGVRDDLCADAATLPDSELRALAKWAWECRLNNGIYRGRDSAFPVERAALDALRRWENDTDAIGLYILLKDLHGHIPGKRFALDFKAMRAAGLSRLSIPRLRAARCTLEAVGLLAVAGKHRAGSVHRTYTLTRMQTLAEDGGRILHIGKTGRKMHS
jgi:hypothetical protein